jgi:class III poly(R)-hydroxyalkanoic acid synthase PhaE subunit
MNGTPKDAQNAASSLMQTLLKAQQTWTEQTMSAMEPSNAAPPLFAEAADEWRQAARENAEAWTEQAAPIVRQSFERMMTSQSAMMQLYQIVVDAWSQASERAAEGLDASPVIDEYVGRLATAMQEARHAWTGAGTDVQANWSAYLKQLQGLGIPMGRLAGASDLMFGPVGADARKSPAYTLFESMRTMYDDTFGKLIDSPALGLSREFSEKLVKGFKAFQEYQEASTTYQGVTAGMWAEAMEQLLRKIGERAQQGDPVGSVRELTKMWTKTADGVFVEAFQTDTYIEAQNEMLSATLALRKQQRVIAEEMQRLLDQPTRSELDEVYELLYKLRKQGKELRAEVGGDGAATTAEGEADALRAELDALAAEVTSLKASLKEAHEALHALQGAADEGASEAVAEAAEEADLFSETPPDEVNVEIAAEQAEEADAADDVTPEPDDFTTIKGIGQATQDALYAAGLTTYAQLADATRDRIRDALGADISADRLSGWQRAAADRADV